MKTAGEKATEYADGMYPNTDNNDYSRTPAEEWDACYDGYVQGYNEAMRWRVMKTIEDWISDEVLNYDWEMNGFGDMAIKELLEKGAKRGILEALRWRDPKVELPENGEPVIVKYVTQRGIKKYGIAKYFELGIGNPWTIEGSTGREVIGWRPIE